MLPMLLAQTGADVPNGVSPEFYGMVILVLMSASKWLFDYRRQTRDEATSSEPRANPPLHRQFVSRDEFSNLEEEVQAIAAEFRDSLTKERDAALNRFSAIAGEIKSNFNALDGKRSASIAGLHDDLRDGMEKIRSEVRQDNTGIHTRITEVISAVAELRGRLGK